MSHNSDTYQGVKIKKIPPKVCISCKGTRIIVNKYQKLYCADCKLSFFIGEQDENYKQTRTEIENMSEFLNLRRKFGV